MMRTHADRERRRRGRRKAGRRVYAIEADEVQIEAVLSDAGYLPSHGSDDPEIVRRALERAVGDMVAMSLPKP